MANGKADNLDLVYSTLDSLLLSDQHRPIILLYLSRIVQIGGTSQLVNKIISNTEALSYIARHANLLIELKFHNTEWFIEILRAMKKTVAF